MPTNVSPEYKKAEAAYRRARDPAERLTLLKEMLATIPKHKGTEHLQADIKTRIKELTAELAGPRKGGARTGPVHTIRPEGAAQVALIGPPNSGKSRLHSRLTGSQAEVGPYPHTTTAPLPGMLLYEDVQFQLVDLPPISTDYMDSWMPNALQPAHAALLILDLGQLGVAENLVVIRDRLQDKRIHLTENWNGRLVPDRLYSSDKSDHARAGDQPPTGATAGERTSAGIPATISLPSRAHPAAAGSEDTLEELEDPFRVMLPTILVFNKIDLGLDIEEVNILAELTDTHYPALAVSAETGQGLGRLGALLFQGLGIVRVYTKIPGKPADYERPFTVFSGDTVEDVARLIHKDVLAGLKYAKVWGSAKFDGQQVGRDYVVHDGDVLEMHT